MRTAAACVWAAALAWVGCRKPSGPPARLQPHQSLEDFTIQQSEGGKRLWSLSAEHAVLKEDERQALMTRPRMEFYKDGRLVTKAGADAGTLRTDTSDVRLSSSVVVSSLEDQSVLKTEELLYVSQRERFVTERDVIITRPGGVLRGKGLEATPSLSEIKIFRQTTVVERLPPQ